MFFIISLVAFTPFVYFAVTMETSTDFMNMLPSDFEGNTARNILSNKMAFGNPFSTTILFHDLPDDPASMKSLYDTDRLCNRILTMDHVKTIRTTVRPLGGFAAIPYTNPNALEFYTDLIQQFIGEDGRTFYMEVYLDVDAYSREAYEFVRDLNQNLDAIINDNDIETFINCELYVICVARVYLEMQQVTNNSYPIIVPVVIVGVFLILFFLFGSYFTPVRLIITIGMSILFTLAMVNLVYFFGFGAPILWLLPIMMFSILMGLGLDYDIFLVSRVKEYCEAGMTDNDAIAHSLEHISTIITSCGIVMAAAFSSLMFSNLWHINELGFAFTFSIILDAIFIWLVLVPSIMVLLEKLNWKGPKRLQKIHRDPIVQATMKTLGDNIGIEIYSRELKETLEEYVKNSSQQTNPSVLIDEMIPIIEESIETNKVTDEIKIAMITSIEAVDN